MEESLGFLEQLKASFGYEEVDIRTYSPLTLAFLGDGVYELVVRSLLVGRGNRGVESLHKEKSRYVNAKTQAQIAENIRELFTQEEEAIYRRGRNTNIHSSAKNASMSDYRKATGLEALCGYLYLQNNMERLTGLLKEGFERVGIRFERKL